ncbi:hypothetical protein RBSWK_00865 [Rhodopirellula baltica SWK14]|uniref:Uncharacterized protein n=1 Tax=Rhodopirellula baltica SWK14 TaxID=993516 RepID=L7CNH8_RHOBT|nr:hypothetical protein RBSWK_00865 [Rhodopirellula baltica SWK14]
MVRQQAIMPSMANRIKFISLFFKRCETESVKGEVRRMEFIRSNLRRAIQ